MTKYVYSWHRWAHVVCVCVESNAPILLLLSRKLVPEAESFEDHIRVMIRYVVAMLLRRAQRLDVPHMIMHKFLPVAAAHIHIYMKARVKGVASLVTKQVEATILYRSLDT